jgi:hypothetical protein
MAAELFNSVSGFSVGIPPIQVIDGNGNVVTNVLTPGNVAASSVYATTYFWANGQPFTGNPGGTDTHLQFNNHGSFGGIPNATFDGSNLTLGDVSTVKILGGTNGYVLQTDGTGNLSWTAGGGGGGNGSPGGSNSQVQFNSSGLFAGSPEFLFDNTTNTLSIYNLVTTNNANLGDVSQLTILGGSANYVLQTDGTGNLSWTAGGGGGGTPGGSNTQVQFNNNGSFGGTANLTFSTDTNTLNIVGNANVYQNLTVLGNISVSDNVIASNVTLSRNLTTPNANITSNLTIAPAGTLYSYGVIDTSGSPNINLGSLSNVHISGGSDGFVLQTDGLGNLSWTAGGGGGGNGSPGGANTQVQFNNNGSFSGTPYFTFNNVTNTVQVSGNLIANSFQMGSGSYLWSSSQVYFATTASTAMNQVLYSIPVSQISAVEFEIIATDAVDNSRQSGTINSLYYNGTVEFNEYATLFVNGGIGNFDVEFNPGNVINPPSLDLSVTPSTNNTVVYKMLITIYAP